MDLFHIVKKVLLVSLFVSLFYSFFVFICSHEIRLFNTLFKIQEENDNNYLTNLHINELFLESKKK